MSDHRINNRLQDTTLWLRYKKEMCQSCEASCCYMPVEVDVADLVKMQLFDSFISELSLKEQIKSISEHPDIQRYNHKSQKYTLKQRSSGACPFLDNNKRCRIYALRPKTCANHPLVGPRPGYCAYIKRSP